MRKRAQMIVNHLQEALDGAQYVEFSRDGYVVGVWHGGHTVNYYAVGVDGCSLSPTDTQSIGDYETGETTLEDAQEAIRETYTREE